MKKCCIGAHFSISGGLWKAFDRAEKYDCQAMQIFVKSPTVWRLKDISDEDIESFKKKIDASSVTEVMVHAGYLINLGSPDLRKNLMSRQSFIEEIKRVKSLELNSIIFHPGSHVKTSVDEGIKRVSDNLKYILDDKSCNGVNLIFETTAGQGNSLGSDIEDIKKILELTGNRERFGLCIDTCHVFASGYDISSRKGYENFISEIEGLFGEDFIKCWHLNDSKTPCGSKIDRHEHIGEGKIGNDLFRFIMQDQRFLSIPKIIETEDKRDGQDMNERNLSKLRSFIFF